MINIVLFSSDGLHLEQPQTASAAQTYFLLFLHRWEYFLFAENIWCLMRIFLIRWEYFLFAENIWCLVRIFPFCSEIFDIWWEYLVFDLIRIFGVWWEYFVFEENIWHLVLCQCQCWGQSDKVELLQVPEWAVWQGRCQDEIESVRL